MDACRKAYVGKGSFIVDARPSFAEVLPGSLYVFLSPATAKGAIGGFGVMTYYDQRAPIIRNTVAPARPAARVHGQPLRRSDA